MKVATWPDRSCYRPGETVRLKVELAGTPHTTVCISASITFLSLELTQLTETVSLLPGQPVSTELPWTPPAGAPRGYGVDLQLLDESGRVMATASTAFDVLEKWTQAPRYGFLTDFRPDRANSDEAVAWLTRFHINAAQFYDWMYRHDELLPPSDTFTDPLGRQLSLATVTRLIDALHSRNIAAMPYTAIYGASIPFYQAHPDWALFDEKGAPFAFHDFLMIMNPAPKSPWTQHLLSQLESVLRELPFDGIHIDQYGEPKAGYDDAGNPVDLAEAMPAFINTTKALVAGQRGDGAVVFNAVANWPVEAVAPSNQDVVYVELWPPDATYLKLHQRIVAAQVLSGGKPVVLAAYIDPAWHHNVRLADAAIFASGGFHIELGEPGGMLADPYFPKYGHMDDELAASVRRTYDFAVRYENVLSQGTLDTTSQQAGHVQIKSVQTSGDGNADTIWIITRAGEGFETLSLINLLGVSNPVWNERLPRSPTDVTDLKVRYHSERRIRHLWWASPDGDEPQARPLDFYIDEEEKAIEFTIPSLAYWDLIVLA